MHACSVSTCVTMPIEYRCYSTINRHVGNLVAQHIMNLSLHTYSGCSERTINFKMKALIITT